MAPDLDNPDRVCQPLSDLHSIWSWDASCVHPDFVGRRIASNVGSKPNSCPKTLVCHDYAGGYREDRFVDGCSEEGYRLLHWNYIDIFVYFSHHLLTIPPRGWIDVAHLHGVPILGTFITEWNDGVQICGQLFRSRQVALKFADRLVEVAEAYNFDGWLVNIENKLADREMVQNMLDFVRLLTDECRKRLGPTCQVIWYDSVTIDGNLCWQNELNESNQPFFNVCNGIFLNYVWKRFNLEKSVSTAIVAGRLPSEVFVGIDVFGRNCPGGGGFKCNQALSAIRSYNLSAAIFAPGWVFETLDKQQFASNEQKFWDYLAAGLHCRKVIALPVQMDFCAGVVSRDLEERCLNFNLTAQSFQPHYLCDRRELASGWPEPDKVFTSRLTWFDWLCCVCCISSDDNADELHPRFLVSSRRGCPVLQWVLRAGLHNSEAMPLLCFDGIKLAEFEGCRVVLSNSSSSCVTAVAFKFDLVSFSSDSYKILLASEYSQWLPGSYDCLVEVDSEVVDCGDGDSGCDWQQISCRLDKLRDLLRPYQPMAVSRLSLLAEVISENGNNSILVRSLQVF